MTDQLSLNDDAILFSSQPHPVPLSALPVIMYFPMKSWFLLFISFLPLPVCIIFVSLKSAKIADLCLKMPLVCNF